MSIQDFIAHLDKVIIDFETGKPDNKSIGIIYTPQPIVDYIVSNIFKLYFEEFFNLQNSSKSNSFMSILKHNLCKNANLKTKFVKKLKTIKVLDPACGSGRFMISVADKLFYFYKTLNTGLDDYEIKQSIIKDNLYGIEIEETAFFITKLRLLSWLFSGCKKRINLPSFNTKDLNLEEISQIVNSLDIKFNVFNLDFLLAFDSDKYDIIIGNPPYVENKKIKNTEFKKKLTKRFKSAYRLFDLSVVFIEKSLELLKEREGFLSMITTNKFLSADYGIHIRKMLIFDTEIKEIINISSLPIFGKTAAYPIIFSLKKSIPKVNNTIKIKRYEEFNEIFENSNIKSQFLPQKLIKKIPAFVFPIFGQINLINYLYTNFKPLTEVISDLKILYRPYGFINWSKHLNNVKDNVNFNSGLLLCGTGNIAKYHIKFDKLIKIAKKILPISYFKYQNEFKDIWKELMGEKLIFREIAKELTWMYDPGIYTNVTGLYFVRIPSFNQNKLFCLLAIMNSRLMDIIFKTLFSSLHMAGGYMRFNGSFIKRLPMPHKFPLTLSHCGKILQILSQLDYDLNSDYNFKNHELKLAKDKFQIEIVNLLKIFNNLSNSLVNLLYLDELYLDSNKDFNYLRELLYSNIQLNKIQFKYLLPRYQIKNYHTFTIEELELTLDEIKNSLNKILENEILLNQIQETQYIELI